jgi:hypothetical protein
MTDRRPKYERQPPPMEMAGEEILLIVAEEPCPAGK